MIPTVNEILQLRPKPKNYKASKHEDLISRNTIVQEKLDGWRFTIMRLKSSALLSQAQSVIVIGRKRYVNYWDLLIDHTMLADRILDLPPDTVLDGEYHIESGTGTDVPTLMREKSGDFIPWAIPWLDGKCLIDRSIPHVNEVLRDLGWTTPYTETMKEFTVEYFTHDAEAKGIEGYVLKTSQWNLGSWFKIKPTRTFDLLVTGVVMGTSRNEGKIGSLCVSARRDSGHVFVEVGKVGGLSDKLRETSIDNLVGRVVEICAQDVTRDGRLKFARLVRFRDDKDISDATTYREICDAKQ